MTDGMTDNPNPIYKPPLFQSGAIKSQDRLPPNCDLHLADDTLVMV